MIVVVTVSSGVDYICPSYSTRCQRPPINASDSGIELPKMDKCNPPHYYCVKTSERTPVVALSLAIYLKVTSRYGTYVYQLLLLQALLIIQGYPYSNTD